MWRAISKYVEPPLDLRGWEIANWLRGDHFKGDSGAVPFDALPKEDVLEWIDAEPEKRAALVAYIVPSRFADIKNEDGMARQLLIRHGNQENVKRSLEGSFSTGGWWGPASAHFAGEKRRLEELLEEEQQPRVREWIATFVSHLSEQIEQERVRERGD